jgi:hypothetical protein
MRWGRWSHRLVALFLALAIGGGVALVGPPGASAQSAPGEGCAFSRNELRWLAATYVNLLASNDPAPIAAAPDLRATENGEVVELGEGLWQTAGAPRFIRTLADTDRCGTHTEAVLDENGADIIVGVRLLIEGDELAEIETYVTREGDYFFYNPDGLVASDGQGPAGVRWENPVPEAQRSTRERLIEIADLYYESFGSGGVLAPIQNDCHRWENGQATATGDCSVGITVGSPDMITHRRYPFVDVEAGVVVAYVMFGDALDFHMFKVVDGQVRLIDALVTASGHDSTGWEDQEQPPAA